MTTVNDAAVLFFYTDDLRVFNDRPFRDGGDGDKNARLDEHSVDERLCDVDSPSLSTTSLTRPSRIIMGDAQTSLLFLARLTTLYNLSSASPPRRLTSTSPCHRIQTPPLHISIAHL